MDAFRRRFPWLTEAEGVALRELSLRRAATGFEQANLLRDAAECWVALSEHARAGDLYARSGNLEQGAGTLLDAGRYGEALDLYRRWEAALPEGDLRHRVQAALGQAACHHLGAQAQPTDDSLSTSAGREAYRRARGLLERAETNSPLIAARCWSFLGEYGARLGREDLVQVGYERALALLEENPSQERTRIARLFHSAVRRLSDQSLSGGLEDRLAQWGIRLDEPDWLRQRAAIEAHPFRDHIGDVLHFMHAQQWQAWMVLADMEDQPDVDTYLRQLTPEDMVYIPPGTFLMGSPIADANASSNEKPQHGLRLRGYYIDRYPVTNRQYKRFIEASGYENREYWTAAGWEEKERQGWMGPRNQSDPRFGSDDAPVVGVSWYEAAAYARWSAKELPSEAEWEKAASWDPTLQYKRRYPWGDAWEAGRCQTQEAGGYGTVLIGRYSPQGDSAYGVGDLGGNVNEWCRSKSGVAYPYDPADGREELEGDTPRALRGGSWNDIGASKWSRCAFRAGFFPPTWSMDRGFRCVCRGPFV